MQTSYSSAHDQLLYFTIDINLVKYISMTLQRCVLFYSYKDAYNYIIQSVYIQYYVHDKTSALFYSY